MRSQPKLFNLKIVVRHRYLMILLLSFIVCVAWTESEIVVNTVAGQFSTNVDSYHNGPLISSFSVTSYMACIQSCLNARCPSCSVINFYGGKKRSHASCELRREYTDDKAETQNKDGWILATMIIAGPSGSKVKEACTGENLASLDWYPSCYLALASNNMQSNSYAILPVNSIPGSVPIRMLCVGNGTAVLPHNLTVEQRLEGPISRTVKVSIEYDMSTVNLTAVVLSSASCRQTLTINCYASGLNPFYWISRTGKRRDYFGPSTLGSGCMCGVTKTCERLNTTCNCYANDMQWRQDSVIFQNDKEHPVMQLVFSDLDGSREKTYFRLGELYCLL